MSLKSCTQFLGSKFACRDGEDTESGNVLFLILIAVALFAALSYAVTQSTRSGSGSTDGERSLLNSATLTQYPATIRTAVVRMILGGIDLDALAFEAPSSFGGMANTDAAVFHPQGGGAVFQNAPSDVMATGASGTWFYNGNFEVTDVGQAAAEGNELIAFLLNVNTGVCRRLNEELGIVANTSTLTGIPDVNLTDASLTDSELEGDAYPITDQENITNATQDLDGQPTACVRDTSLAQNVFYSVILER